MKLGDVLEEILQEWLDSPEHGQKIQELWGVDGYVCVCNFIEYVKERENDYDNGENDFGESADSNGY